MPEQRGKSSGLAAGQETLLILRDDLPDRSGHRLDSYRLGRVDQAAPSLAGLFLRSLGLAPVGISDIFPAFAKFRIAPKNFAILAKIHVMRFLNINIFVFIWRTRRCRRETSAARQRVQPPTLNPLENSPLATNRRTVRGSTPKQLGDLLDGQTTLQIVCKVHRCASAVVLVVKALNYVECVMLLDGGWFRGIRLSTGSRLGLHFRTPNPCQTCHQVGSMKMLVY